jgi:hypothetical protein
VWSWLLGKQVEEFQGLKTIPLAIQMLHRHGFQTHLPMVFPWILLEKLLDPNISWHLQSVYCWP